MKNCTKDEPQYSALVNAVIVQQHHGVDQRMVRILCDEATAQKLLTTADELKLPIAEDIKKALDPLRDL